MTHRRSFAGFVLKLAAGLVFLTVLTAARSQAPGDSAASTAVEGRITPAERRYLVLELNESKIAYLKSIQGLTREQWTFKPTPDRWSVEECAEHIILAEPVLVADSNRMLATPAVSRLATANSEGDHGQVAKMLDRSVTAKAPAAITPSGRFASPDQAAAEFIKRRDATIAYAETTEDPLRSHASDGPAGDKNDAYQCCYCLQLTPDGIPLRFWKLRRAPTIPALNEDGSNTGW